MLALRLLPFLSSWLLSLIVASSCVMMPLAATATTAQTPSVRLAQTTPLKAQMVKLSATLQAAIIALKVPDVPTAKLTFQEFKRGWDAIDQDVRNITKAGHDAIDDQVDKVEDLLLKPINPDRPQASFALERLSQLMATTTAQL